MDVGCRTSEEGNAQGARDQKTGSGNEGGVTACRQRVTPSAKGQRVTRCARGYRGRRPLRCSGKSKTHIKIAAKPQPTLLTPHSSLLTPHSSLLTKKSPGRGVFYTGNASKRSPRGTGVTAPLVRSVSAEAKGASSASLKRSVSFTSSAKSVDSTIPPASETRRVTRS